MTNSGDVKGSYTAELKINGVVENTLSIPVEAGKTETAGFTIVKDAIGSYNVEVDGQSATFSVVEEEIEPEPTQWILIAWIVGGTVGAGLIVYFVRRLLLNRVR